MKFVLFDGNAVAHRAYHALPPLTTKSGEVVHAVYGFCLILLKVLNELKPDCVVVAFDVKGPTFRHKRYAEYKATRITPPEDLPRQFELIKKVLDAFSIPYFEKEGYEADDVIGTIALQLTANNQRLTKDKKSELFIVTGDLDELQLVNKNTKVYTMRRGFTDTVIYDEKTVEEKYGFSADKFVDYKALRGDPSDNIPGVKGIGEKIAIDLIKEYGSLENIYKNLNKLKIGIRKNLELYKDDAFLSRELSKIETNVPIEFDIKNCYFGGYDKRKVFEIFRELEFKSLLNKLPDIKRKGSGTQNKTVETPRKPNGNYKLICTEKDFLKLISNLKKQKEFAFDTETTSLNIIDAKLVGLCFSWRAKEGFYLPVGHLEEVKAEEQKSGTEGFKFSDNQLEINYVLKNLKPILEDPSIKKIGHNLKYDYSILRNYGINLSPLYFDTMIASYILNPNARALSLEDAVFSELGIEMIPITELIGRKKEQINFCFIDTKKAADYAAEDADLTFRLYKHLLPEIKREGFLELMSNIEMPLIPVLAEMEINGVKIDEKFLKRYSEKLNEKIKEVEIEIWKIAGEKFNISSPAQLKVILFEKLKLASNPEIGKSLKKVKSGGYSTAASELEKIRGLHPIIDFISEYRELTKLKSTYVDTLPNLINQRTGRVHTSFNQAITTTGRLSSSDPNLQNIPIRTEVGREIRRAFVAEKGFKILAADYSQIELRIIAHIANDKAMIEAFHGRADIHTRTASLIFGVSESEVNPIMRRAAKVVNFGVIYGISPHGLSMATGMSREESKEFIDKYFKIHPQIKRYMEEIVKFARETGYVETIFGRKRYLPDLNSSNFVVRSAAERMAINMPIQGTAADLMKLAMIDIFSELKNYSPKTKMILQVHDELVFEVPEGDIERVKVLIREKMEGVVRLKVPIEVKIEVGDNWGEMEEI